MLTSSPTSSPAMGSRHSRVPALFRMLCIALTLVSGIALLTTLNPKDASAAGSSAVTVAWTGDTSSASTYQPTRDTSSPHYSRLKNLSVTVDQTSGLIDQAVRVQVSGFAATQQGSDYLGNTIADGSNFVQAMQCWGDPNSATFYENCEWGGFFGASGGVGGLVESDTLVRVATPYLNPAGSAGVTASNDPNDVPFRSIDGSLTSGRQVLATVGTTSQLEYPLFAQYDSGHSNEVVGARVDSDGTGSFDFETENSDTAPQLGCGTAGHLRCWLVVVPRDDIWGAGAPGKTGTCSVMLDPSTFQAPSYGQTGEVQSGSPVNPACDYWDNRVVVPLDFTPTGVTCPQGATERRTIGSDLLVGAMASWQPQLCIDTKTNFSFDTNPDTLSRSELVEGTTDLAFTSDPVTAGELSTDDATQLQQTQISYAPVAVTSAVFGYVADGRSGRITSLVLSPRLVAKLLTQSYTFTVPRESGSPTAEVAHLPAVNRSYSYFNQDPDFRALNPNWADFVSNPAIVLPGPYSDDVIAELWKWIQGDSDARAWLNGAPDPWGMTVNPYYLAAGDPNAVVPTFDSNGNPVTDSAGHPVTKAVGLTNLDGTPLKLGDTAQNSFIKADGTLVPFDTSNVRYPFGSIQASPYAQDFLSGTRIAFRANPGAKTTYDPNAIDSSGDVGAWVAGGPQVVGQRFTIAFTDAASAALYDLSTASLTVDNKSSVTTSATNDQMSAAVSTALVATSVPAVKEVDPTKVGGGAYPLTSVVYADVNLTSSDPASLNDYSKLIAQITTSGQVPGSAVGQLPAGYVPLPAALAAQAAQSATAIAEYVPPASTDDGDNSTLGGYAQDDYTPGLTGGNGSSNGMSAAGSAATGTKISARRASSVHRTPASKTPPVEQWALLGSLGIGVLGSLFSPWLFRRRRVL